MPRTHRLGPFLFVHGSPRNPLSEYIFPGRHLQPPEDGAAVPAPSSSIASKVIRMCQRVSSRRVTSFSAPEEIDNEYTLSDGKVMINVGSVGQPRDGEPQILLRDLG